MTDTKQPEALRSLYDITGNIADVNTMLIGQDALNSLQAENTTLQAGYAAARLEIESLRTVLQVIAEWKSHDIQLAVDRGSNGVRDFYREKAASVLGQGV